MKLAAAITRAAKFATKDGITSHLCFAPGTSAVPPYVMACNENAGTICLLDRKTQLPSVTVDAVGLKSAVSTVKNEAFEIRIAGINSVSVTSESGKSFLIHAGDPGQFPGLPGFPESFKTVPRWDLIKQVVHVADGDEDRPILDCLHLTSRFTEATDEKRVARVPAVLVKNGTGLLVHKAIFQKLPAKSKHPIGFSTWKGNAFLHYDEEIRFCQAKTDGEFFDLSRMIPERYQGMRVPAPVAALKSAVKSAISASQPDWVRLTAFEDGVLLVEGLDEKGTTTFQQELPTGHTLDMQRSVVMKGRLLWDSLHAMGVPEITLGFSTEAQPLRLESPNYVEAIWPLTRN